MNSISKIKTSLIIACLTAAFAVTAQNTTYHQFNNEIQFFRAITDKWATEFDILGNFSDTPVENNILKTNTQRSISAWVHYIYNPRWKFGYQLAYYRNKDVPDIGQFAAPEWRQSLQGTYYIHKIGYTLSTRGRAELRFIGNESGSFDGVFRYRQMLKYLQPLNSKFLRKGVYYFVASEELAFRSTQKSTGLNHFDRNKLTFGGGYVITDDLQIELAYENEFVPRDAGNTTCHALSLTITFNNLFQKIKKELSGRFTSPEPDE